MSSYGQAACCHPISQHYSILNSKSTITSTTLELLRRHIHQPESEKSSLNNCWWDCDLEWVNESVRESAGSPSDLKKSAATGLGNQTSQWVTRPGDDQTQVRYKWRLHMSGDVMWLSTAEVRDSVDFCWMVSFTWANLFLFYNLVNFQGNPILAKVAPNCISYGDCAKYFFEFEFCNMRTIYDLSTNTKFPWVGNLDWWCFKPPFWLSVMKDKENKRDTENPKGCKQY